MSLTDAYIRMRGARDDRRSKRKRVRSAKQTVSEVDYYNPAPLPSAGSDRGLPPPNAADGAFPPRGRPLRITGRAPPTPPVQLDERPYDSRRDGGAIAQDFVDSLEPPPVLLGDGYERLDNLTRHGERLRQLYAVNRDLPASAALRAAELAPALTPERDFPLPEGFVYTREDAERAAQSLARFRGSAQANPIPEGHPLGLEILNGPLRLVRDTGELALDILFEPDGADERMRQRSEFISGAIENVGRIPINDESFDFVPNSARLEREAAESADLAREDRLVRAWFRSRGIDPSLDHTANMPEIVATAPRDRDSPWRWLRDVVDDTFGYAGSRNAADARGEFFAHDMAAEQARARGDADGAAVAQAAARAAGGDYILRTGASALTFAPGVGLVDLANDTVGAFARQGLRNRFVTTPLSNEPWRISAMPYRISPRIPDAPMPLTQGYRDMLQRGALRAATGGALGLYGVDALDGEMGDDGAWPQVAGVGGALVGALGPAALRQFMGRAATGGDDALRAAPAASRAPIDVESVPVPPSRTGRIQEVRNGEQLNMRTGQVEPASPIDYSQPDIMLPRELGVDQIPPGAVRIRGRDPVGGSRHAAFDPARAGESDLLASSASLAGAGGIGAAAYMSLADEAAAQDDGDGQDELDNVLADGREIEPLPDGMIAEGQWIEPNWRRPARTMGGAELRQRVWESPDGEQRIVIGVEQANGEVDFIGFVRPLAEGPAPSTPPVGEYGPDENTVFDPGWTPPRPVAEDAPPRMDINRIWPALAAAAGGRFVASRLGARGVAREISTFAPAAGLDYWRTGGEDLGGSLGLGLAPVLAAVGFNAVAPRIVREWDDAVARSRARPSDADLRADDNFAIRTREFERQLIAEGRDRVPQARGYASDADDIVSEMGEDLPARLWREADEAELGPHALAEHARLSPYAEFRNATPGEQWDWMNRVGFRTDLATYPRPASGGLLPDGLRDALNRLPGIGNQRRADGRPYSEIDPLADLDDVIRQGGELRPAPDAASVERGATVRGMIRGDAPPPDAPRAPSDQMGFPIGPYDPRTGEPLFGDLPQAPRVTGRPPRARRKPFDEVGPSGQARRVGSAAEQIAAARELGLGEHATGAAAMRAIRAAIARGDRDVIAKLRKLFPMIAAAVLGGGVLVSAPEAEAR